jgi:cyclin-dependent kinase 7
MPLCTRVRHYYTQVRTDTLTHYVCFAGRERATGRKIAIKKIKVGQFKDGLDMSAIREVKYLRELRHPNVIEVRPAILTRACEC